MDTTAFLDAARRAGYTSLTLQVGRGVRLPTTLLPGGATEACLDGFTVRYFRFAPDLSAHVRGAALVVRCVRRPRRVASLAYTLSRSHAGAGSIFEALRAKKTLLVVVNEALMDNHQLELAEALEAGNHLRHCTPQGLVDALANLRPDELAPWVCGNGARHTAAIDELCGFGAGAKAGGVLAAER